MNTLQESDWIKTTGYPGMDLGFSHFACSKDMILVLADEKSGPAPGYNYSICDDLNSWSPQNNGFENNFCKALSYSNKEIISASIVKQGEKYKFKVAKSKNGFTWGVSSTYDIERTNISSIKARSRFLIDIHCFLFVGFYFVFDTNGNCAYISLPEKYTDFEILDITFFNGLFYLLVVKNKEIYILTTPDAISNATFAVHRMVWPGVEPKSINCNNNQLIVVGSEQKNKKCVILYINFENLRDFGNWNKITFTPILLDESHFCTLDDALYFKGNWYLVGSTTRLKYNRPFSVYGLTYKIAGDVDINNPIMMESNSSTNLKKIYADYNNNRLYAIGESRPTGDYFLLYKNFIDEEI